ncbi:unnamed protein product [Vitrella brassicaformis CCMP3155]|uniref:Uncharacterized protein n=1 Tax=Vitrella brassicaformis (strain CCMP3155) TaxID=1169540 RepID=A0A0G4FJE0_VITBC|nr:unnamed protein product [Vitrella brassicaformis CCMP3155]|eukprot:CEM13736.1 unnamed protein product [Vitrella brassicaformis CCMP3155]
MYHTDRSRLTCLRRVYYVESIVAAKPRRKSRTINASSTPSTRVESLPSSVYVRQGRKEGGLRARRAWPKTR